MRKWKQIISVSLISLGMFVLILDGRTALQGAQDGIMLCICTVIPSLFPFLTLSMLLPQYLMGRRSLGAFHRLLGIPRGSEALLLLGFLSGYPVGAGMVADACMQGSVSRSDANRMLAFCNNAGPAFIFGMVSALFENKWAVWMIWMIQIASALIVGMLLPGKSSENCILNLNTRVTLTKSLENSTKKMGIICGWVVLFRVLLSVLDRWVLWIFPENVRFGIWGLIELSNGITSLHRITNSGMRFILCSGMIAFGGLCVSMQTASVTGKLGTKLYFPGKILQCLLSILFSGLAQCFLFTKENQIRLPPFFYMFLLFSIVMTFFLFIRKKSSSISSANNV